MMVFCCLVSASVGTFKQTNFPPLEVISISCLSDC
jgi:hypothetical protein